MHRGTAKKYYDWIITKDIKELEARFDKKPEVCDICHKNREISFVIEPFCKEILDIKAPFWMCEYCYADSHDDT
jgi:hypothetical protein